MSHISLHQHLDDIFKRIDAAQTHEEKLDAIDRAWYEVWGMNQIMAGDGGYMMAGALPIIAAGEFREYVAMRYLLSEALRLLEEIFDQLASQEGNSQSPHSNQ